MQNTMEENYIKNGGKGLKNAANLFVGEKMNLKRGGGVGEK